MDNQHRDGEQGDVAMHHVADEARGAAAGSRSHTEDAQHHREGHQHQQDDAGPPVEEPQQGPVHRSAPFLRPSGCQRDGAVLRHESGRHLTFGEPSHRVVTEHDRCRGGDVRGGRRRPGGTDRPPAGPRRGPGAGVDQVMMGGTRHRPAPQPGRRCRQPAPRQGDLGARLTLRVLTDLDRPPRRAPVPAGDGHVAAEAEHDVGTFLLGDRPTDHVAGPRLGRRTQVEGCACRDPDRPGFPLDGPPGAQRWRLDPGSQGPCRAATR